VLEPGILQNIYLKCTKTNGQPNICGFNVFHESIVHLSRS